MTVECTPRQRNLAPYVATPPKPWPHEQIAGLEHASFAAIYRQAALATGDARYAEIVASLPGTERARFQLLHPLAAENSRGPRR